MALSESTTLLEETFDLISATTISGTLYGINFALYCLCAQSLHLQLQETDKRRQTRFTLGYITLLFLCTTLGLALDVWRNQLGYIDHSDFPGGPLAYEVLYNPTTNFILTMSGFINMITEVLTSAIQVSDGCNMSTVPNLPPG